MIFLILGLILGIISLFIVRHFELKRTKEVMYRFRDKKILGISVSAGFFGQESLGLKQVRGIGVLIATDKEVYFKMWAPAKEMHIPLSSITKIETPKSYLGKTKFLPLLKVVFMNEKGEVDSAAWLVSHLLRWKEFLEKFTQR